MKRSMRFEGDIAASARAVRGTAGPVKGVTRRKNGNRRWSDMKGFVFNLQPLLEFRERIEEISRKEFGEALKRLEEEEARLLALKDLYQRTSAEVDSLKEEWSRTPREAGEIGLYLAYMARLKNSMAEEETALTRARDEFEKRRQNLEETAKEKKAVETMREKALEVHLRSIEKEEQKSNDDMVSARFIRRR